MAETTTLVLRPDTLSTDDGYAAVGAADEVAACDPGDPVSHDDDTSYATVGSGGVNLKLGFKPDTTFPEKMAFIEKVEVVARPRRTSSSTNTFTLRVSLNASNTDSSSQTLNTAYTTTATELARPGGGDWVEDDLRDTSFEFLYVGSVSNPATRITSLYVVVTYVPLRSRISLERDVISRKLFFNRNPQNKVILVGGWEHLQGELLEKVSFSHSQGPNKTSSTYNWGLKDWQRGFGRIHKQTIDIGRPKVISTVIDRRHLQATYWEIAESTIAGDPDIADGLPRISGNGTEREFTRDSVAWVEEVGGVIKQINTAKEKFTPTGQLLEESRTNLFTRSSFVSGTTGWATTGAGTFAADTSDLLFDSSVSSNSARLVYNAPSDTISIDKDTDSLQATTRYTLSIDHKDDSGEKLTVSILNNTTGNYLQAAGGSSWGATKIKLDLTTSIDKIRDQISFTTESTTSIHKIEIQCETTAGQENHVYHVQVEAGSWMSSRIVTDTLTVTRSSDFLTLRNDNTLPRRTFPVDRFTCRLKILTQYLEADTATNDSYFLALDHGVDNWIRLYQVHGNGGPVNFEYRTGGVTHTASVTAGLPGRDDPNGFSEIVIQKTSSSAENGVAANTITLFVNGASDTASSVSTLTEAATSTLTIGSLEDGTKVANIYFKEIRISPFVYSSSEILNGALA